MTDFRLSGLEPDNLLAFFALLGLLRALEAADSTHPESRWLRPRATWDMDHAPLRPVIRVAPATSEEEVAEAAAAGLDILTKHHDFGGRPDLDYPRTEARHLLSDAASNACTSDRGRADVIAALMTDGAIRESKDRSGAVVEPTPLCLLFGQGHQHFLDRFAGVLREQVPPPRGRGKSAVTLSAAACLAEALFAPWHRTDPTFSFRWDPEEDVRYALMAGNPTNAAYKGGTQHGANRLAVAGLTALTVVPQIRAGRARAAIPGGAWGPEGFSFVWPVWRGPTTLAAIRALLGHPALREPGGLTHLGVTYVFSARRISVGKFMNFTRGRLD